MPAESGQYRINKLERKTPCRSDPKHRLLRYVEQAEDENDNEERQQLVWDKVARHHCVGRFAGKANDALHFYVPMN